MLRWAFYYAAGDGGNALIAQFAGLKTWHPKLTMTMEQETQYRARRRAGFMLSVVAMVQQFARRSHGEFQRLNSEWSLAPDDWLKIKFIGYNGYRCHVQVSLGLAPEALPPEATALFQKERWPGWSQIDINDARQLPALRRCLTEAFYRADSDYRKMHGKPRKRGM